jgi:hypothetical protein
MAQGLVDPANITGVAAVPKPNTTTVSQNLQCVTKAINSLPTDQQTAFQTVYNQCVAPVAAAPVTTTSTYAAEGMPYPIAGTHPTWVILVSMFAIVSALVLVKNK